MKVQLRRQFEVEKLNCNLKHSLNRSAVHRAQHEVHDLYFKNMRGENSVAQNFAHNALLQSQLE